MAKKDGKRSGVMINRAPVLTLWAAGVAEVLVFEHEEALTLGRAVAGLDAYSKGVSPHAQELISFVVSEITKLKKYEVYSQENMRTLAGWTAQQMQLGCTDTKCLTDIG